MCLLLPTAVFAAADVALDADDVAQIGAVLSKGASPAANGDIWSFERGLA